MGPFLGPDHWYLKPSISGPDFTFYNFNRKEECALLHGASLRGFLCLNFMTRTRRIRIDLNSDPDAELRRDNKNKPLWQRKLLWKPERRQHGQSERHDGADDVDA